MSVCVVRNSVFHFQFKNGLEIWSVLPLNSFHFFHHRITTASCTESLNCQNRNREHPVFGLRNHADDEESDAELLRRALEDRLIS